MTNKITYTKAIKANRLKTTEMEIGASVAGTLKGFKPGKYGSTILVDVQGREVEIFPSGNLKFLEEKVNQGNVNLNTHTIITRKVDGTTKSGYAVTQYDIVQGAGNAASAVAAAPVASASVKDKLQAIRNGN